MSTINKLGEKYELGFIRVFDVPVEKVWKAWTEPALLKQWRRPESLSSDLTITDFRKNGGYIWNLNSADGQSISISGAYLDIAPLKRIVYTQRSPGEKTGETLSSVNRNPVFAETIIGVTFEELDGTTRIIVRESGVPEEIKEKTSESWNKSLEQLERLLKSPY